MSTATLLREARRAAGLSQAQVAHRAGTSQPAVARYEGGTASPSVSTLERLLRACGRRLVLTAQQADTQADLSGRRARRLRLLRQEVDRLARLHGASNVRVFGSVARGDDRSDSDIDLLVDFDVLSNGALPLIRLRRALEEVLGESVDVATVELLRPEIRDRVEAEAVPL